MVFIVLYAPFEMNLFINTHFDNKMALAEPLAEVPDELVPRVYYNTLLNVSAGRHQSTL